MRFSCLAALPLAAVLLAGSLGLASAGQQDFRLVNRTGYQIDEVYVSQASASRWGRDVMGSDALADGDGVNITFPRSTNECSFDVKVKYNDGDEAQWGGVDLCKWSTISLFWRNGQTRAVGE